MASLNDLVLKLAPSPDGRVIAAINSGYLPHGVSLIDARTHKLLQTVPLKSTWLGLAWAPDGKTLYVSGGNANGEKKEAATLAPIYALAYRGGRLVAEPGGELNDPNLTKDTVWWAGLEFDTQRGPRLSRRVCSSANCKRRARNCSWRCSGCACGRCCRRAARGLVRGIRF